ncbi:hypothetical protein TWF788_009842 [Orbilia oligospora]|uniref:Major facilitator superfamily (MFS) profile domain-containing protein n=1 Tax=Orbilia oligospora TaxID=2813651 RepID=A0A6G1M525_ORBOL|nr:hypothetical protein TWF788_009842 [Orbilia oligospora]KAF3220558.1 hypothetical protein TWF191_007458 [Orbilia oligospora]KAF3244029.1 hypothetical protein TWF192_007834 [Orbilia oligospora]
MAPRTARPDFPVHQLVILSICRLVEPIAFTSIYPYIYYMVAHFHVTKNDAEIAMWTGGSIAAFAFAEMLTGMMWGRLSDKVGRKPVLIGGLLGTGLSMLLFGLAPSMPLALCARALGGLLNGNVGVIQTTVAELVPKREYQPRAFSLMPFIWSLGSIIGPTLGGMLAEPVAHYPEHFSKGSLFDRFPYLLPNLVCSAICLVGAVNGVLFLDETHPELIDQPDRGRNVGFWIQDRFSSIVLWNSAVKDGPASASDLPTETSPLLNADPESPPTPPLPQTPPSSSSTLAADSRPSSSTSLSSSSTTSKLPPSSQEPATAWTPQVLHNVFAYAIIAFHSITYDQLLSVFLQSPSSSTRLRSPLVFTGGFGLDTQTMGVIFSYQGILSTLFQFLIFTPFVHCFGVLRTFRFVAITYPLIYFLTPYMAFLPHDNDRLLFTVIYIVLSYKTIYSCLIYPVNSILLTNAAPSLLVLGEINGAAGSVASCMRAIAPIASGWLYSKGVENGVMVLSWWAVGCIAAIGGVQALWITEENKEVLKDEEQTRGRGAQGGGKVIAVVGEDAVRFLETGELIVVVEEEGERHVRV